MIVPWPRTEPAPCGCQVVRAAKAHSRRVLATCSTELGSLLVVLAPPSLLSLLLMLAISLALMMLWLLWLLQVFVLFRRDVNLSPDVAFLLCGVQR